MFIFKKNRNFGYFDYIIVGSGSAGSIVANRLSEDNKWSVLLLEAGVADNNFTDIPAMGSILQLLEYNWGFNSTPQETCCLGFVDNQCPFPRGKVLGGTTVLNSLMYVRGNRLDYDKWADEGNRGWSFEDVLPYFIKSENSNVNGDVGYHGKGGYLNVDYYNASSPIFNTFIDGNIELGQTITDFNGKEQIGVGQSRFNTLRGKRQSTARAFLDPVRTRKNLKILTNAYVIKILITKRTRRAGGVLFTYNNRLYIVRATKEIILSAGVVGTPQILMLSGVGPADQLRKHGIHVIQDLAVGENLQDHFGFYSLYITNNYTRPLVDLRTGIEQYLKGCGPLTIATDSQGLSFFRTNISNSRGYPDIELVVVPTAEYSSLGQKLLSHTDEVSKAISEIIVHQKTFQIAISFLHPKSKGTVKLKSKDPYEYPIIDHKCLSHPDDVESVYAGIQLVTDLVKTNAFQQINATLVRIPLPACNNYPDLSKEYWICLIKHLGMNVYHPVGTCKMGTNPGKGAVVNEELKVYGIKNLRIADASVVPFALSGHMSAPAMMVGEMVADVIKNSTDKAA